MRRQPSCLTCARLLHSILFQRPIRCDYEMDYPRANGSSKDINIAEQCVNEDLKHIDSWLDQYGLISNHKKTEVMVIGSRYSVANARDLHVKLNGEILKQSVEIILDTSVSTLIAV